MKTGAISVGVLLTIMVAYPLCAQEAPRDEAKPAAPAEARPEAARPQGENPRAQEPARTAPENRPAQEGKRAPEQPQHPQAAQQKEQQKQATQQQKDQQKQALQEQKDQEKQAKQQQNDQAHRAQDQNRPGPAQPASRTQAENSAPARPEGGGQRGSRIPDDKFRAHFGREHSFRVSRPVIVEGQPRFQYSGYWFELVDPWPAAWSYEDDCYIDYVDDEYWLLDPRYPGVRIAIVVK